MRDTLDYAAIGSSLGRQLMQGANAYEDARTKMGQMLAQQGMQQAHANLYNEQAKQLQQRGQYQTPEYASKIAAAVAGLTDPQAAEMSGYMQRGNWGENVEQLPPDVAGPPMATPKTAPAWATPETMGKFNAGRAAHLMNLGGTGNTNAEQMTNAFAKLLNQGRIDSAIADPSKAAQFGRAMAASEGKPLFHQGANGVMDQFTGAENLNEVGRSAAIENRAQAGNAAASAALHRAQIPEVQSRIDLNRSKIGAPTINPDGSVTAPTGKPIKLSSTAEKELFEADDLVQSGKNVVSMLQSALDINDKAYSGFGAKQRAVVRSNMPGKSEGADATIDLDNLMTGQALESLKATFGAAPTEGERKILMDMQASAEKTPDQRRAILLRAMTAAEKRIAFNEAKAQSLRSGTYQTQGPAAPQDAQEKMTVLRDARAAIAAGADRSAVIKRLKEMGIKEAGL